MRLGRAFRELCCPFPKRHHSVSFFVTHPFPNHSASHPPLHLPTPESIQFPSYSAAVSVYLNLKAYSRVGTMADGIVKGTSKPSKKPRASLGMRKTPDLKTSLTDFSNLSPVTTELLTPRQCPAMPRTSNSPTWQRVRLRLSRELRCSRPSRMSTIASSTTSETVRIRTKRIGP